jgi:hypothetical protein
VTLRRAAIVLAALSACCCCAATPALAQPETSVSIRPSFLPDRLGASTSVTLALEFSGGEAGVPEPLSSVVVALPAGLVINLRGVRTCAKAQLERKGASGCPSGSLIGRGHALLEVHAGTLTNPEEATVAVFRGLNRGALPTFEIFGQGETPLDESTISTAVLGGGSAPYGLKLKVSVPPIPTLVFEPNASFKSLSLTIGGVGRSPRAHAAAGAVLVPRNCPAGGFPFAAGFTFADESTTSATANVPCP